jgi:multiple sugar transport system ATP-binding protein
LRKRFPGGVEAVAGIDLEVGSGEFLVVVGPSGSGKSTLLRLVAGLETPSEGEVWIAGRRVDGLPPRERDVAMVFQDSALYPHLSVFENLAFGLQARGVRREEVRTQVDEAARLMGLEGLLARRPAQLSGGQRRRVALGRALVRRPALFLLDEPLSNLDGPLRLALRAELAALHRRLGATLVMVTHDQTEALALGDRVAVVRDGQIVQQGTPRDVYERPADRFIAGFMSALPIAFLQVSLDAADGGYRVVLADGTQWPAPKNVPAKTGPVVLGLRPEAVAPAPPRQGPEGVVVDVAWLGREGLVTLRVGGRDLYMLQSPGEGPVVGDRIATRIDGARALWFDTETGQSLIDVTP